MSDKEPTAVSFRGNSGWFLGSEVERVLVDHRITGVPVTDEQGHVIGVLSMRDLVERYTEGASPRTVGSFYGASTWDLDEEHGTMNVPEDSEDVAADVMTAEVHAVEKSARVPEIARLMNRHEIHRM